MASPSVEFTRLFIGNEWVDSVSGKTFVSAALVASAAVCTNRDECADCACKGGAHWAHKSATTCVGGATLPSCPTRTQPTINPADGSEIVQVQEADAADVDKAVKVGWVVGCYLQHQHHQSYSCPTCPALPPHPTPPPPPTGCQGRV